MKRKRVEAWAWVRNEGSFTSLGTAFETEDEARRHTPFMHLSNGYRLVRLVEFDAAREAVVRAGVRAKAEHQDIFAVMEHVCTCGLCRAVERMQKGEK